MARPDRVDIVLFHRNDILQDILIPDAAAALRGEFMAVDTVENNALSIQAHDAVFQFKAAETNLLSYDLSHCPICVTYGEADLIETDRQRSDGN